MTVPQQFKTYCRPSSLFVLGALVVLALNLTQLWKDTSEIEKRKKIIPFYFQGFKFSNLEDILNGVKYVGYYTDKDITATLNAAEFAQAQYIVAPVILDLNNTDHEFILFDCKNEETSWQKIKELGVTPLRKNKFGIILARGKK